jgi:hypothetical protein
MRRKMIIVKHVENEGRGYVGRTFDREPRWNSEETFWRRDNVLSGAPVVSRRVKE